MGSTTTIIISAIISLCISKIMAERYLCIALDQLNKIVKEAEEKLMESIQPIVDALSKR